MKNLHDAHVQEFDKEMQIAVYSDVYKSLHGIRPRWMYAQLREMSIEQIDAELDQLGKEADAQYEFEQEWRLHDKVLAGDAHFSEEWQPEAAPINNPFAALKAA